MDSNFGEFDDKKPVKKKGKYSRMRGLNQYKTLSDEEFEAIVDAKSAMANISEAFETRINKKLQEFEEDYDLSDMKINDRDTLRALIQAHISLEDYEQELFKLRAAGIGEDIMYRIEKLQKVMSDLRADISKFQTDLNITRKVRKSDQDVSVLAFITNLKDKAKKFYENKMGYIFCPKCNMLLGTIWTLYPEEGGNKVQLICNRVLEDGTKCGEKVIVGTKELLNNRGTNNKEVTPESML
jgi:hypothetical protein